MTDVKTSPVYTDENGQRYYLEHVEGEMLEGWGGRLLRAMALRLMIPDPIRECWSVEHAGKTTFRTTSPGTVPEGAIVRRFVEVDEAWEP